MTVPRLFDGAAMTLMGRRERYSVDDAHQHIPVQWAWFGPRITEIFARHGTDTFGVCSDGDDEAMTYFCGVRVSAVGQMPGDLVAVAIPALRYAVFSHEGPVSNLSKTIVAALGEWLPEAGLSTYRGHSVPDLVEHYGADFNPQTGLGSIEIWIPVGPA